MGFEELRQYADKLSEDIIYELQVDRTDFGKYMISGAPEDYKTLVATSLPFIPKKDISKVASLVQINVEGYINNILRVGAKPLRYGQTSQDVYNVAMQLKNLSGSPDDLFNDVANELGITLPMTLMPLITAIYNWLPGSDQTDLMNALSTLSNTPIVETPGVHIPAMPGVEYPVGSEVSMSVPAMGVTAKRSIPIKKVAVEEEERALLEEHPGLVTEIEKSEEEEEELGGRARERAEAEEVEETEELFEERAEEKLREITEEEEAEAAEEAGSELELGKQGPAIWFPEDMREEFDKLSLIPGPAVNLLVETGKNFLDLSPFQGPSKEGTRVEKLKGLSDVGWWTGFWNIIGNVPYGALVPLYSEIEDWWDWARDEMLDKGKVYKDLAEENMSAEERKRRWGNQQSSMIKDVAQIYMPLVEKMVFYMAGDPNFESQQEYVEGWLNRWKMPWQEAFETVKALASGNYTLPELQEQRNDVMRSIDASVKATGVEDVSPKVRESIPEKLLISTPSGLKVTIPNPIYNEFRNLLAPEEEIPEPAEELASLYKSRYRPPLYRDFPKDIKDLPPQEDVMEVDIEYGYKRDPKYVENSIRDTRLIPDLDALNNSVAEWLTDVIEKKEIPQTFVIDGLDKQYKDIIDQYAVLLYSLKKDAIATTPIVQEVNRKLIDGYDNLEKLRRETLMSDTEGLEKQVDTLLEQFDLTGKFPPMTRPSTFTPPKFEIGEEIIDRGGKTTVLEILPQYVLVNDKGSRVVPESKIQSPEGREPKKGDQVTIEGEEEELGSWKLSDKAYYYSRENRSPQDITPEYNLKKVKVPKKKVSMKRYGQDEPESEKELFFVKNIPTIESILRRYQEMLEEGIEISPELEAKIKGLQEYYEQQSPGVMEEIPEPGETAEPYHGYYPPEELYMSSEAFEARQKGKEYEKGLEPIQKRIVTEPETGRKTRVPYKVEVSIPKFTEEQAKLTIDNLERQFPKSLSEKELPWLRDNIEDMVYDLKDVAGELETGEPELNFVFNTLTSVKTNVPKVRELLQRFPDEETAATLEILDYLEQLSDQYTKKISTVIGPGTEEHLEEPILPIEPVETPEKYKYKHVERIPSQLRTGPRPKLKVRWMTPKEIKERGPVEEPKLSPGKLTPEELKRLVPAFNKREGVFIPLRHL